MSVAINVKAPRPFVVSYNGGHPLFPRPCRLLVWGDRRGVHLRVGGNTATIPWGSIKALTKVTWTELIVDANGVEVALLFGDGANGYALMSQLIAGDARSAADWEPGSELVPWTKIVMWTAIGVAVVFVALIVIGALTS